MTKPVLNPAGGSVSTQGPGYPVQLPPDLQAMIEAAVPNVITRTFRQNSNPQRTQLQISTGTSLGSQIIQRLENIGLVQKLNLLVSASIVLANANSSASTVTPNVSFPYNVLSNIAVMINANNQIVNASPYALLHENFIRHRFRLQDLVQAGTYTQDTHLSVSVSGTGSSLSGGFPGTDGSSGYTITCGASGNTTISVSFVLEIPFVLNEETLVGLLPLQNNTTQINLVSTINPTAAGNGNAIFSALPSGVTLSSIAVTVQPSQVFWTVPQNPALYQSLVANSFQIVELPNNPIVNTGTDAVKYLAQLETYLLRCWFILRDSNNNLLSTLKNIVNNVKVYYNAVVPVYNEYYAIHRAEQRALYGTEFGPGVVLWDGNSTVGKPNEGDDSAWLDMFQTANPSFRMDLASGSLSLPGSYSAVEVRQVPAIITPVTQ